MCVIRKEETQIAEGRDPFDIVREWWGDRPVKSDTEGVGINPSTKDGAFECLILGILYAIEGTGSQVENTFHALRDAGYTKLELLSRISGDSGDLKRMEGIFKEKYFGGRLAIYSSKGGIGGKIPQIIGNAKDILADQDLRGDIRKLHLLCGGDGHRMLQRLWKLNGIKKKTFWMMREMRIRGVWDVDGKYCCVPDKQVGSSLKRWNKIKEWPNKGSPGFKLCLRCSEIVWDVFGELYDFPILYYAREHKCNDDHRRTCAECKIIACKDRSRAILGSSVTSKETKYCIECGTKIPGIAKYCPECGMKQVQ